MDDHVLALEAAEVIWSDSIWRKNSHKIKGLQTIQGLLTFWEGPEIFTTRINCFIQGDGDTI